MHLTAADKEIFTIFTSGSTGTPKRIEHSYADVVHCIESYNFKINGAWLDAYKISNIIEENIKILESVVSGEISNNDTTKIVAYIVAKQKIEEEDIKNIRFTIIKKLGRQYVPQKFYLVENIPKGITGKVNRSKLNEIKIEKVY